MRKSSKKAILIILTISFLIATPSIILYAQGYRFDFEQKRLVQTGAFYFKTSPDNAQIFINSRGSKKTSLFFGTALVENLLPKDYDIEIRKEGYFSWKKTLPVKEKVVTEAKNIVLFPQNPEFVISELKPKDLQSPKQGLPNELEQISESAKGFAISPNKEKIAFFDDYEIWLYFLKSDYGQPRHEEKEKVFLTRFSEKIRNVVWLGNYHLAFGLGSKIKAVEIDTRDGLNIVDIAEFTKPEIFFNQDSNTLYVLNGGKIFASSKILP